MNCPNCGAPVKADDVFCGNCAQALPKPAATSAPEGGESAVAAPVASVVQAGTYSAEISRQHPACLVFLIDQSGSMNEPIGGGSGETKKAVVADAVNRLMQEIVLRCAKEDAIWGYFDVGVWSYGGPSGDVHAEFGSGLTSISTIGAQPKRNEMRKRRVSDGAGGLVEQEFHFPIWFDAVSHGLTPMNAAFRAIVDPLRAWIGQHPSSYPPILINLTDGAFTDENPLATVQQLMQLGTSDGNVLVFNCHISKAGGQEVKFPDDGAAARLPDAARQLYDMSSRLTDSMRRQAEQQGYLVSPGSRGYVYNAELVTLIEFLDIGTHAVQDRVEVV